MTLLKNKWFILVVVIIAAAVLAAFTLNRKPGVTYFTAKVEQGDIHDEVEATGTINAVTTVQVGSQVSGTIYKLFADFNSHVKRGEVIAEIEPSLFQGALLQAKADLQNAQANYLAAKANLEKARATAAQASADYTRAVGLAKDGVFSQQQLDAAKATTDSAVALVAAGQAAVEQAAAQVSQKKAAVDVAQTNLDHTIIRAPIDGVVVNRNVDVGQTVAASLQAPTLFTIAQDLTKMQVYVATDESDVGAMRVGEPATFKVDAFPKETFTGRVSQVRLNATTVQNVVTYTTVVDFDNPQMKLFPGMTAYVTIPVANALNVLKVPNGALRYKPDLKPEEIQALYAKAGIPRAAPGHRGAGGGDQARGEEGGGGSQQQAQPHRGANPEVAVVWKLLPENKLEPVQIKTGITDHTYTAVSDQLHGTLKDGEALVIGSVSSTSSRPGMPGMGGPSR